MLSSPSVNVCVVQRILLQPIGYVMNSRRAALRSKMVMAGRAGIVCARPDVRAPAGKPRSRLQSWLARPFVLLIRGYQLAVSPLIGWHCRFIPTCSQYGIEALETHGVLRGGWLTLRRLLRCRPGGGSGYDPVPQAHLQENVTE